MTEVQIKHMVERFLAWRLPADFNPDGGVSYQRPNYHPSVDATLVGTNLLSASQAEAMVRHMIEGLEPASTPEALEKVDQMLSDALTEAGGKPAGLRLNVLARGVVRTRDWIADALKGGEGCICWQPVEPEKCNDV